MPTVGTLCETGPLTSGLVERLDREWPEVPRRVLDDWVREVGSRFEHARVRAFVAVLVERGVRDRFGRLASAVELPLSLWSGLTARRLLAADMPRRWAHSRGVARRAE